jgi:hypothetical protein
VCGARPRGDGVLLELATTHRLLRNELGWSQRERWRVAWASIKDALDVQDKKFDKYLAALRTDVDALNKDSLGLDPKNKEDAQKIAAARKPLMKYANSVLHESEGATKDLKKLSTVVKSVMGSPAPPGHDV